MVRLGIPVPSGICLTSEAFFVWLGAGDLLGRFRLVRDALREGRSPAEVEALATDFRAKAAHCPMPDPVLDAVVQGLKVVDGELLAVRSSGNLEDQVGASFAGLYETCLDVNRGEVSVAIRTCWMSLFSPRSLRYLLSKKCSFAELSMAVVIQTMVAGEYSGVCFSLDPMRGDDQQILIEVAPGRGDALVSGKITPSRFWFHKDLGEWRSEFREDIPAMRRQPLLDVLEKSLLPGLTELCCAEGVPLDVEFVVSGEVVWFVQARPITRIDFAPELGEWTNADFNEGGVSSAVCSQFMWSLYDFIWRSTLPEYFYRIGLLNERFRPVQWARVFFGVPYWNVGEVKRCLRAVPGFDEENFDEDLGIEKDYRGEPWKTPVSVSTLLRAIPILFSMYREFGRQRRESLALLEDFGRIEAHYHSIELQDTSDEVFFELFRQLIVHDYARVEGGYFMTIFNSSNAKLEFKSSFDAQQKRVGGTLSYLNLMSGMKGLRTLESVHDLHRLARKLVGMEGSRRIVLELDSQGLLNAFQARSPGEEPWASIEEYLDTHAHHSVKELDLRVHRWGEDVRFVLERVSQSVREFDIERDPEKIEQRQYARYLQERKKALASFSWNLLGKTMFRLALDRSRHYCWLREEVRDCSTRLYYVIRIYTLELARRFVERGILLRQEDIFYLPFSVCLRTLSGAICSEEVQALVATNRSYLDSFRNYSAPKEVGAGLRRSERPIVMGEKSLTGVGGAPGVARGPVRIVHDLRESSHVQRGDVLVATFTDPGWTPLLEHVAGVVTEVGGVLSHAAVISREYGVPAVLSVRGATRHLNDGMLVEVDGDAGCVRILSP
jgi:pyruvate,water dikinase